MSGTSRILAAASLFSLVLFGGTAWAIVPINNAGFEGGPLNPWPGYGAINDWTRVHPPGGSGTNPADDGGAPFLNGQTPPEGTSTAFIQAGGTLSQSVGGFVVGKSYVLQYFESERGLTGATSRLQVDVGGQNVVPLHNVNRQPGGFYQVFSEPFTVTSDTNLLELIHPGDGTGDNTVLIDQIVIAQAGGIENPSFEDGPVNPWPGYGAINGWTRTHPPGNSGTNPADDGGAPFLNGLAPPDGDYAGFLQGGGTLSQTIAGLEVGRDYILQYFENARQAANPARLQVDLDGTSIVAVHDVPRTADWRTVVSDPFTATAATALLEVTHPGGGVGDNTAVFDNFLITPAGVPYIKNPGFEEGPAKPWPGYGRANQWNFTGGGGTNPADDGGAPFLNGLDIPEGAAVGFIQGSGSFSQTVVGLEPGKSYLLQYYENERGMAGAVARSEIKLDGQSVVPAHDVTRTPKFVNLVSEPFTATATSALLEAVHPGGGTGDNTVLFDGFLITEAGVPFIKNAGFEDTGLTFGGSGNYYSDVPGWLDPVGNPAGVALASPHYTATWLNGLAPPQGSQIGFIQGGGTFQQAIAGLEPGKQYILQYFENERNFAGSGPPVARLQVNVDGVAVVPAHDVTRTADFRTVVSQPFTATSYGAQLEVTHPGGGTGDNTALFDDFIVTEVGNPVVKNAGFEEGPVHGWPGYGSIDRWTRTNTGGNSGTNDATGPFVNGLAIPDGDWAAFIQRSATVSQIVVGLDPGKQYVVEYYQNERGFTDPAEGPAVALASVAVDGSDVVGPIDVIRTDQFRRVVSKPFIAGDYSAELAISNARQNVDNSLLVDAVRVREVGTVLFQDNFDLPNNPPEQPAEQLDINVDLGSRQAGVFAGTPYVESAHSGSGAPGDIASQVDLAVAPDALMLGANAGVGAAFTGASPDANFNLGGASLEGPMVIELDIDPFLPGSGSGDNWASIRFGDSNQVQSVNAPGDGFGILFREGGAFQAFDGDASVSPGGATAFSGPGFHAIRIELDMAAFDGSPASLSFFADGATDPFFTYDKQDGFANNFITLGGFSGVDADMLHGFDNLNIWTAGAAAAQAIPEPSTWLLLTLGALGLLTAARRKRVS